MGNVMNTSSNHHRQHGIRRNHPFPPPPPPPSQPEIAGNRYVFAAATPYPSQYPNPNPSQPQYYHYPGYYNPPPVLHVHLPAPFDHHHPGPAPPVDSNWVAGRYPCPPAVVPPAPCIEHQKAVTIRNDVNIKKESLRIEPDEENPGKFLVAFTFDATVSGSITVMFFGKEGGDCSLVATREAEFKPATVEFEIGLGQTFKQPSGTGIDASILDEAGSVEGVFPLAIRAASSYGSDANSQLTNCQITQAMFEKEKGVYRVRVLKQILWVNGTRYELQEIYGTGNSVDNDAEGNDPSKECVICLSEPRDTTVLPCRHMCLCSGCAKVLRFQSSRCPICRQTVERLLEMKIGSGSGD